MTAIKQLVVFSLTFASTSAWAQQPAKPSRDTQLQPAPARCSTYIEKGNWVVAYNEWSLQLVPTKCGRAIQADETPNMFYEIVKKFGDPETFGGPPDPAKDRWKNVKGMIDQLTCHLTIARNKPTWNLEPHRPWVGYEATVAAECNPYIKSR